MQVNPSTQLAGATHLAQSPHCLAEEIVPLWGPASLGAVWNKAHGHWGGSTGDSGPQSSLVLNLQVGTQLLEGIEQAGAGSQKQGCTPLR